MIQQEEIKLKQVKESMKELCMYAFDVLVYSLKELKREQPEIPYLYKEVSKYFNQKIHHFFYLT